MRKVAVLILVIPVLFAFVACAKKEGQKGSDLAKVGNVKITQADLEREIKNLPDFAQKIFEGSGGKERFLNELIKKELLYQEALKKGLDKNTEYMKKVEDFKKITLIGQLLEKEIESKTKVTDQDVKDYYEKHKEDFAPVSQIRMSLILVKTEEEAKKILERLNKGEDFAKVAKKSSINLSSAKNGGDLGYLSRGQMTPELEAAAVRLKTGEISEPLKTQSGYQIIKVTDKKIGKVVEFERVKNFISQHLSAEKQKEVFDSYIESLKKSYKVDINKEAISKLGEEKKEGAPGKK
ncbi:MAG: peptidylprolyl isomerase [Nitrospirae bacterium CG_4_10_14_0_8_um_filter_41_23]|nr:peptidylprolyl isomerase [Nitrospirota bacterium]PIQ93928.1 MAG: peptidylprolyl isomerase [Nitrospirae bacterium CG11_big_fil_rev_8_21_14_0_20_41_14]PIV43576.1 MAG: peptidylprolyl isomerase [Nitrospirae bacterium CG02_land_8_20_14_3_00_41_53]PIW86836.1 MAG: peptidylprolyl isomerase [Nitrospirae bacterium CG_4_8_14_3_um_filter_41_47]PIY85870.1 MAG: peptidylprolyl isomerase [Nitrospirae bacterium CG_4_10_14_0_8_um_filter_41_23]PJA80669.1 MAG: peptidylprolyl isomerase [Nitrospirae bacterium CG